MASPKMLNKFGWASLNHFSGKDSTLLESLASFILSQARGKQRKANNVSDHDPGPA